MNQITSSYIEYDCKSGRYRYPEGISAIFGAAFDERPFPQILIEDNLCDKASAERFQKIIAEISASDKPTVRFEDFNLCGNVKVGFICTEPSHEIVITFSTENYNATEYGIDELTGLLDRTSFGESVEAVLRGVTLKQGEGMVLFYLDVQRFKIINDMFGKKEGDRLLCHIADVIRKTVGNNGFGCRIVSDRFAFLMRVNEKNIGTLPGQLLDDISCYDLPFEITCNAGIYIITDRTLSADSMIDRAVIAQSSVKGSYTKRYKFYAEELRKSLMGEQEIIGAMRAAIEEEQFLVYYQPQYNHTTGMLVGAEALVRWLHPEKGIIPPNHFIPVFEKNGFITKLDLYVFEKVCVFIKKCMDKKIHIVPVSVNLTRYDIFTPNFIDTLDEMRAKYDVPAKYLRIEITESAALGNSHFINEAVKKLHSYGYVVEMDDFGSGYSSLNILKDIDFDIIKLDMKFLHSENDGTDRGGTILSSVVRMVNWLGLPIIAEGVETVKQADFLQSVGCDYIQGYLYSKPLPEEEYEKLLSAKRIGATIPSMKLIDTLDAANFWSSDSLETLIFSNFVGGAAIFDYHDGKTEVLRVNKKYLHEYGMNYTEKDLIGIDLLSLLDDEDREKYEKMLELAIDTGDEQECETWRNLTSNCCGEDRLCIRSTVRMIGKSKSHYLFYVMVRNITAEKLSMNSLLDTERRFKAASEQVNIYFWEYTVSTREMRPCFRCMRDLGLPPLLTNYPDSAIEMGVFPPEVADMYRDWHVQIANGVKSLEAVMPLTAGRVPFHVRYTTEFDENGNPIKAYGSAALVVDK